MALADVLRPAIGLAEAGFVVTPYLQTCIGDCAADLSADADLRAMLLPEGSPVAAGSRLRRPEYGVTLQTIAQEGAAALYGGALGTALTGFMATSGGLIGAADLAGYTPKERFPVHAQYRGHEIVGPPPPASSGVHIAQMLGMLEGFDVGAMGFGSVDTIHLLAEVLKCAFADRAAVTADPDFVDVPVERLISPDYAAMRRGEIDLARARSWRAGIASGESADTDRLAVRDGADTDRLAVRDGADTTHLTVADSNGMVVSSTQTINALFGARVAVPGTGMICNNYMFNFDPHPGHALSIAPGKRVFTSMAPMMVLREGRLMFALGLPGALRIFPSALQAIVNLIDHGMTLQEAVEAPRMFTQGHVLEVEAGLFEGVRAGLAARDHEVVSSARIAGGMNAVGVGADGILTGAACWRADGTPVGIGGGLARAGTRFVI
jgi:gamma-glutamyltranspeptidase/glutathione hydrolase